MAGANQWRVYTDGACHGNPGPGGFAAILVCDDVEEIVTGAERRTTNNRMELTAAIRGLESLRERSSVRLVTDSQYVVKGMTEWLPGWIRRRWKNAKGKPVVNQDLWHALARAARKHDVTWEWTAGHAGHSYNERCDRLANEAIERLRK